MIRGFIYPKEINEHYIRKICFSLGMVPIFEYKTKSRELKKENEYYKIYKEIVDGSDYGSDDIEMEVAYTPDGKCYIGDPKMAKNLMDKGIHPELIPGNKVCSIGKSDKDGKWYGWSHRAIYGFEPGDRLKDGDIGYSTWGNKTAKDEADAKNMAIAFAREVS